jgi:bacillaene synthase trans-acting acyltransferase
MPIRDIPIVFLFSGQGSHYRGMGQSLFEHEPVFRSFMEKAERIGQKQLNRSILHELYTEKHADFDDLLVTHPAIVAVEIAMLRLLESIGIRPDYINGNSLGEFAAAVAAGAWSGEQALEAAIEQAKSIVRSDARGGMLTVLHQNTDDIHQLYDSHGLFLASDNFNGHFTVSGTAHNLDRFQPELDRRGIEFQRLQVVYPFHSPLIDGGEAGFVYHMSHLPDLAVPQRGFISGITGEELSVLPMDYFWQVARSYTNFPKVVRYTESKGPCLYIDLGPSGTCVTFIKYNLSASSGSRTFSIMTQFKKERQQLEALKKLLDIS